MPKPKKKWVEAAPSAQMVTDNVEEPAPCSSPERKPAGRRVVPPSPGRKLRLEAGKSVRSLRAAFMRVSRKFLKAEQAWNEQQQIFERVVAASEKRAAKAHPKGALRTAVAARDECKHWAKLHLQHDAWAAEIVDAWKADTALLRAEKLKLELQVAMLQRKVRRMRHGAPR